jgi:hypothetical protein
MDRIMNENDTLFLVCIQDKVAKKIQGALVEYSKLANDIPTGSKHALSFLSKLYKDFKPSDLIQFDSHTLVDNEVFHTEMVYNVLDRPESLDTPPPEVLS